MQLLENKIAIVTGGTRGIGRAIVETFLREGAKVVFTGRSECPVEMQNLDGAWFVQADGTVGDDARKVVDFTMEKFGRIDILVNNAGINRDTLLDAQRHPEKHRHLIVRVWGWSGYFVELDKVYQDHIIRRAEMPLNG